MGWASSIKCSLIAIRQLVKPIGPADPVVVTLRAEAFPIVPPRRCENSLSLLCSVLIRLFPNGFSELLCKRRSDSLFVLSDIFCNPVGVNIYDFPSSILLSSCITFESKSAFQRALLIRRGSISVALSVTYSTQLALVFKRSSSLKFSSQSYITRQFNC